MFNFLKEMQETISYEDLCKYTYESVGKSSNLFNIRGYIDKYSFKIYNICER